MGSVHQASSPEMSTGGQPAGPEEGWPLRAQGAPRLATARSRTLAESCQQAVILSLRWEPWPHKALTSAGETEQRGSQPHVDADPRNTLSSAIPFVVICHPGENKYNLCSQNSGSWPAEHRVTLTLFSLPAVLRAKGAGTGEAGGPDSSYGALGGCRTEGKAELAI